MAKVASVKNPHFGVWPSDDEQCAASEFAEAVDERSAQAFALVEEQQMGAALDLYYDDRFKREHRVAIKWRVVEFSRPRQEKDPYMSPLTKAEAEKLLGLMGIGFYRVLSTYLADWRSLVDRDACRVPHPCAHCVVARVPSVTRYRDGKGRLVSEVQTAANMHLFFAMVGGKWRLVKAAVEREI
ncbi:hypothetical protein [Desulfovirgula thermocuniculi]|uniref:hypothetical protein n=1 Tax=Desulfovirgula thermocuniculi TaxID=348842 RepID=UPI000483E40A|nr:hypothetical protein [Desulfovirgula thermocuniculi]